MIPVIVWFRFPDDLRGVCGHLPALPRVGDGVAPTWDSLTHDWVVESVSHRMFDGRIVEVDLGPEEGCEQWEWTRRDRIRFLKQLEDEGWDPIDKEYCWLGKKPAKTKAKAKAVKS